MTKKSRRTKRKGQQVRLSPAQMIQPESDAEAAPQASPVPKTSTVRAPDLRDEYRYVIADLKRIGIIALVMLGVLITLALLLP